MYISQNEENTIHNIVLVFMLQQHLASKHYRLRDLKMVKRCLKLQKICRELTGEIALQSKHDLSSWPCLT